MIGLHEISIANFINFDTCSYPLIILKGFVKFERNTSCKNKDKKFPMMLNLNGSNYNNTVLVNGQFKILVELKLGLNNLILSYCCESVDLSVTFCPRETEFLVIPLYIICTGHDGKFQAPKSEDNSVSSALKRIDTATKILQCITAEILQHHNLGRKTFEISRNCATFYSQLRYEEIGKMNSVAIWEYFGREIMNSNFANSKYKYLAFLSCTNYNGNLYVHEPAMNFEELIGITTGYVALGGGGLAIFGTGCLYTWPVSTDEIISRFMDETAVVRKEFLDDSCYRNTLGACFSTTLGSTLHELYHTFNLGHTKGGIMGSGYHNIYKMFTPSLNNDSDRCKVLPTAIKFYENIDLQNVKEPLELEEINKKSKIIMKMECNDDIGVTKSCAVLLSCHKWFNDFSTLSKYVLSFDSANAFIKSTLGIRVVEIRKKEDELVLHSWTFDGKVLRFLFQIPIHVYNIVKNDSVVLVVEDLLGNIIKEPITTATQEKKALPTTIC